MLYIAVPIPSTILSKKLNVMNVAVDGIRDTNLCVCVCVVRGKVGNLQLSLVHSLVQSGLINRDIEYSKTMYK